MNGYAIQPLARTLLFYVSFPSLPSRGEKGRLFCQFSRKEEKHACRRRGRSSEGRLPGRLRREGVRGRQGRAGRESPRDLSYRRLRGLDWSREHASGAAPPAQGLLDLGPPLWTRRDARRPARLSETRRRSLSGPPELQQSADQVHG